nr:unnamed protein product [Spirometra erinaceieuropaei]
MHYTRTPLTFHITGTSHLPTEVEKLREHNSLWNLFLSLEQIPALKAHEDHQQGPAFFRALNYIVDISEAAESMLIPLNVGLEHQLEASIRLLLIRPKDRMPSKDTSGIIYRVSCLAHLADHCEMTDKRLRTRMHEHDLVARRKNLRTQVTMHSLENSHQSDFDSAQVLRRPESKLAREIMDSWEFDASLTDRRIDRPAPYKAFSATAAAAAATTIATASYECSAVDKDD